MSEDKIGHFIDSNYYHYSQGNPVAKYDPLGLFSKCIYMISLPKGITTLVEEKWDDPVPWTYNDIIFSGPSRSSAKFKYGGPFWTTATCECVQGRTGVKTTEYYLKYVHLYACTDGCRVWTKEESDSKHFWTDNDDLLEFKLTSFSVGMYLFEGKGNAQIKCKYACDDLN